METLVTILIVWFAASFVAKFFESYNDIAEERGLTAPKLIFLQITVENIKGLWYGWHIDDEDRESFVAQGTTYEEAILNCKRLIETKNPEYKILFKFKLKHDDRTTLQNQRERNARQ